MDKEKLIKTFDRQAKSYEKRRLYRSEEKWRRRLLPAAKGNILEVGVGAGANFQYYPKDVKVTAVDFSLEMLDKAKVAAMEEGIEAQFVHADVETLMFEQNSFDTIVSTLSLCGYDHPIRLLQAFNKWCKPDGQILLLEHGKSSNIVLSTLLTLLNPLNKRFVGCHLNRDILKIVQESNIAIERVEHYIAGAVHLVWAKPYKADSIT